MRNLSRAAIFFFFFAWAGAAAAEKIDVNAAPLENLVKIIHIGEARAKELISLRPFSSLDDLTRIKGIGEAKIEDIKKEGLAWVGVKERTVEVEPEPKKSQLIAYPSGIVINEILPSPEGPDETEEWIELSNQNNFEAELSGWQIADTAGKTAAFVFPAETKIALKGFLVLSRPTTKITLNNDGDGLSLIQPDGNIIDAVTYEKAPRGQSYNRVDSRWAWSTALTPGSANIIPKSVVETKETITSEKEISVPKKELAAIGEQIPPKESLRLPAGQAKFLSVFLIALPLAIFSGIIILTLKRKIKGFDLSKKLE